MNDQRDRYIAHADKIASLNRKFVEREARLTVTDATVGISLTEAEQDYRLWKVYCFTTDRISKPVLLLQLMRDRIAEKIAEDPEYAKRMIRAVEDEVALWKRNMP